MGQRTRSYRIDIVTMLTVMSIAAAPVNAGSLPALSPGAGDRCPVCGMFVTTYPDWVAQVRFRDQETVFFDGAKDFFKYCFRLAHYRPDRSPEDFAIKYVRDYYTMASIDAATAYYVVGSDVYGPMGHELIAFASAEDAAEFMRDHRGRRILRFEAITPELVTSLD